MKKLNGREMKVLLILSIVVPIGLLTTFRLTGLLPEPLKLQSFVADAVEWRRERPGGDYDINGTVENSYRSGNVSITFSVLISDYDVGGSDRVYLRTVGAASVSGGFVEGAHVEFREDFQSSNVEITGASTTIQGHYEARNLQVSSYAGSNCFKYKLENNTKAFVTLTSTNRPREVYFNFLLRWFLMSAWNQSHESEVTLELTYRTGKTYEKATIPIMVILFKDNNDSFETAQVLIEGKYPNLFIGPDVRDAKDYYKINLTQDQRVSVTADGTKPTESTNTVPFFDLYLYDPERNLVTSSSHPRVVQTIEFVANATGYWFIEVRIYGNYGFYSLEVNR